tara:strand:+ start:187 stop:543 length:357 start_codon:yes stop_codon:yes gene_type:complete
MANMSVTKAREILDSPSEYTKQEVANAKTKLDNPKETVQMNKGGVGKNKKVPVISISVGMADVPKGKKGTMKMANGGMANGRPHMYLSEGALVTDKLNPGLKALAKKRPDVVKKILGK